MNWHLADLLQRKHLCLLLGPCGTGKSHLHKHWHIVRYVRKLMCYGCRKVNLFSELQAARAAGRYEKKFAELAKSTITYN